MRRSRAALLWLALLSAPAHADIVVEGAQHIGDSDSATLQPGDPVTRRQHFREPTNFHLSARSTVTAVRLNGLAGDVDAARLKLRINGNLIAATFGGDTFTLASALVLAGNRVHTLALDPGCSGTTPSITSECPAGTGNDIGFSAITLSSAQTTTSTNLARRRHIGRNSGETNNYAGSFYPDAPECLQAVPAACSINISFGLAGPQRLTQLRFYRLRDVDTRASAVPARVLLDGAAIGSLNRNQDPFRIDTNTILFAGTHTLTITAGTDRNGLPDDISWDEIHLLYTFDSSLSPGAFNAVDTGADALTGRLQTKVAGSAFAVDLVALTPARDAQQPGYSGTVNVELLDATDDSGAWDPITSCRASWRAVQPLPQVTFVTGDGRQPLTGIVYGNALRSARLRITQTDNAVQGCSADAFALRPDRFAVSVTGPGTAASYAATATPTHRAGRPFTVQAIAETAAGTPATNYSGQPTLVAQATLLGANLGVVSADNWTDTGGVARTDNARYSEAGAFVLRASDSQFAAIDVDDTSLTGDGDDAGRRTLGEVNVGRFIPDHFAFESVQASFAPGCSGFTYAGQRINFAAGQAPVGRITARAFGGTTTENYSSGSGLYKLPLQLPQSVYAIYDDAAVAGTPVLDLAALPLDDNDVVEIGSGVAEVRLTAGGTGIAVQRPGSPGIPFDAEIQITLGALGEPDLVDFDPATPGRFGEAAAGNGIPFLGAGTAKQIRFGRLVVGNAHGSERLPLEVPLRTEYWSGAGANPGFVTSTGDTCTVALAAGNVIIGPAVPLSLTTAVSALAAPTPVGRITLSAPGETGYAGVAVDLSATLLPWLRGDWNVNGDWGEDADDPRGRASFGLSRQNDRRIYQREVVGG